MTSLSILFDQEPVGDPAAREPDCFGDLNLDQVVATVTAGREEYDLTSYFWRRLDSTEAITYRQEVFADLDRTPLFECIGSFAQRMRTMRKRLAEVKKLHYIRQRQAWFLEAIEIYCDAVRSLLRDLTDQSHGSAAFEALRAYLVAYTSSSGFESLVAETIALRRDLAAVTYSIHIRGDRVTVDRYASEADYSAEVHATFAKFEQGTVEDHRATFPKWLNLNHVEAQILDLVARLNPEAFASLAAFYDHHQDFLDDTVARFDREVQFYLAYLEHLARLRGAGLSFCYPEVSGRSKNVSAVDAFDLALADKLIAEDAAVVGNDLALGGPERILVVSGPNQGGKTTFARTFGQLHFLASLGCPVPGRDAHLFLFDELFTHFEREESLDNLRGKLEDELVRVHDILERATPDSIVIMNEVFSSTTLHDALALSREVMADVIERDMLCLCVTFLDELAALAATTVSMVSEVDPADPARRTYKLTRRPADGLAYADAIATKYGLSYQRLRERIGS